MPKDSPVYVVAVPPPAPPEEDQQLRRRRRGLLRMYYGVDEHAASKKHENPLDIDATGFKPELYMEKLMKESVLTDLYQQEERMKKGGLH